MDSSVVQRPLSKRAPKVRFDLAAEFEEADDYEKLVAWKDRRAESEWQRAWPELKKSAPRGKSIGSYKDVTFAESEGSCIVADAALDGPRLGVLPVGLKSTAEELNILTAKGQYPLCAVDVPEWQEIEITVDSGA